MDKNKWARIEEVYQKVVDLAAPERNEFLAKTCAREPEIRKEVESLLKHTNKNTEIDNILGEAAVSLISNTKELIGMTIGPYRLIQSIGEGGMGTVYLAERSDKTFQQKVAIKISKDAALNSGMVQRFKVERQILANLHHDNIARLIDGGTLQNGLSYLVMEYVDGEPIDEYCNRLQLSIHQRLKLFIKVCSAIKYAHQNLVVHRDIKPSNVLVTKDGEVYLLDFGIAKLLDTQHFDMTLVETQLGERLLTPLYSSPEQVKGETITTASDIYSLGIFLFKLLTNRYPYQVHTQSRYEIEHAIINAATDLPSNQILHTTIDEKAWCGEVNTSQLKRMLRGDLDNIVMKAVRKKPERRYSSVAGLMSDINHFLNHRPVSARKPSLVYIAKKFLMRNKLASALSSLLLLAILLGSVAIFQQSQQVKIERDTARVESDKARAISQFLIKMFSEVDPDQAQGKVVTVRQALDAASERLDHQTDHELANQPLIEAAIRTKIGSIYQSLDLQEIAGRHLLSALALYEQEPDADPEAMLSTIYSLNRLYLGLGRDDRRIPLLTRGIELGTQTLGVDHEKTLLLKIELAGSINNLGDTEKALSMHLEAYEASERALGSYHYNTILALANLGADYNTLGQNVEATQYFDQVMERGTNALGEGHYLVLYSMSRLTSLYQDSGNGAAAEAIAKELLERTEKVLGPMHQRTLESKTTLAWILIEQKHFESARALLNESLFKLKETQGMEHFSTLWTQKLLAKLNRLTGNYSVAIQLAEETLKLEEKIFGFDNYRTLITALITADIYLSQKTLSKAKAMYQRILSVNANAERPHPDNYYSYLGLAKIYKIEGNPELAIKYYMSSIKVAEENSNERFAELELTYTQLIELVENSNNKSQVSKFRARLAELKQGSASVNGTN